MRNKEAENLGFVPTILPYNKNMAGNKLKNALSDVYKNWDPFIYEKGCDDFMLNDFDKIKRMSSWDQKSLGLVVLKASKASFWILDEPSEYLDAPRKETLRDMLQDHLKLEKNTAVVATNRHEDFEDIADYIVLIDEGVVKYSGSLESLRNLHYFRGSKEKIKSISEELIYCMNDTEIEVEALIKGFVHNTTELETLSIIEILNLIRRMKK